MKLKGVKIQDLDEVAKAIVDTILNTYTKSTNETTNKKGKVIYLSGDLGAGKTTLAKAIGKALGVKTTIHSPTFIFMNEHKAEHKYFENLIHVDAYRFENKEQGEILELNKYLNDKNLLLIEWPENMIAPASDLIIKIEHKIKDSEISDSRNITIK